jgi:hypothetical protein
MRLFAGDGESTGTGAAERTRIPPPDFSKVRTRRDLSTIINEATDPVAIKQEILDQQQSEPMEYDNDENFLEILGERGQDSQSMDEDETLLDEEEDGCGTGEEGEVVLGEEEEGEGEENSDSGEGEEGVGEDGVGGDGVGEADGEGVAEGGARGNAVGDAKKAAAERKDAVSMAGKEGAKGTDETEGLSGARQAGIPAEHSVGGGEGGEGADRSDGEGEDDPPQVLERDELDSSLRPDHRFFAVRALVEKGRTATKLNRRMKLDVVDKVGFLLKGDERYFRNANECSIERRVNVSSSFTHSGRCHTCLNGQHDAWQGRHGQPVVVAAGDQHYPANLPARGDGECIRIIRVENGSLAEITSELIRMSPRGGVVPGTVIMLGSVVMLGVESVAHYAAEWKKCRNILKQELGEVIVIPLLHLSPIGIEDRTTLRALIDMAAWYEDMDEVELKLIRNTRLNFMEVNLSRLERGPGWADTRINSRMPVSLAERVTAQQHT